MDMNMNISETQRGGIICRMEFKIYAEDLGNRPELADVIKEEFNNMIKKMFDGKRQRLQTNDPFKQMAEVESKEVDGESNMRKVLGGSAASYCCD